MSSSVIIGIVLPDLEPAIDRDLVRSEGICTIVVLVQDIQGAQHHLIVLRIIHNREVTHYTINIHLKGTAWDCRGAHWKRPIIRAIVIQG